MSEAIECMQEHRRWRVVEARGLGIDAARTMTSPPGLSQASFLPHPSGPGANLAGSEAVWGGGGEREEEVQRGKRQSRTSWMSRHASAFPSRSPSTDHFLHRRLAVKLTGSSIWPQSVRIYLSLRLVESRFGLAVRR